MGIAGQPPTFCSDGASNLWSRWEAEEAAPLLGSQFPFALSWAGRVARRSQWEPETRFEDGLPNPNSQSLGFGKEAESSDCCSPPLPDQSGKTGDQSLAHSPNWAVSSLEKNQGGAVAAPFPSQTKAKYRHSGG